MSIEYMEKLLKRVNNTNGHITCCLPCHFHYEEEVCFQYLTDLDKDWIKREHKELGSHPDIETLLDHSRREREVFKKYCPKEVVERIDADHLHYCQLNNQTFECEDCKIIF